MLCDKTKQCTADILIPHKRVITLVFWHQHWLVGDARFVWNLRSKWPTPFEKGRVSVGRPRCVKPTQAPYRHVTHQALSGFLSSVRRVVWPPAASVCGRTSRDWQTCITPGSDAIRSSMINTAMTQMIGQLVWPVLFVTYEPVRRTGKSDDWLTIFSSHNKVDCSEIPIVLSNLLYHYFFHWIMAHFNFVISQNAKWGHTGFTLIATGWRHCWHVRG